MSEPAPVRFEHIRVEVNIVEDPSEDGMRRICCTTDAAEFDGTGVPVELLSTR